MTATPSRKTSSTESAEDTPGSRTASRGSFLDPEGFAIGPELIEEVCERLRAGKRVRRTLGAGGRLHIDRELPFLCVYRHPVKADPGTAKLVTGEASYLVVPALASVGSVRRLIRAIDAVMREKFGAFLVVEVWAKPDAGSEADPRATEVAPVIEIHRQSTSLIDSTVEVLAQHLARIEVQGQPVEVRLRVSECATPRGIRAVFSRIEAKRTGVHLLGIAVPPVYRDESKAEAPVFPLLLKSVCRGFGLALRRAFYEFSRHRTTHRPPHYHELGRRAVVKAVWKVDGQLADVSKQFDYLLGVTPINTAEAWTRFHRSKFEDAPEFHYLPLPFDPPTLKRALYRTPIERIEDPALARLFLDKQAELDRKITMLADRNTPRFLFGSLQLFGGVSPALVETARDLLRRLPAKKGKKSKEIVSAKAFAERARKEIATYAAQDPIFSAKVRVTSTVAGVMVSRGRLLIGKQVSLAESRVDPLIQHEVGTHLVTYYNGRAQPFRQLASGLAGYEELQEGLAVLSEHLVGGLDRARLRQLAGRVLAVRSCVEGATFIDTFRSLVDEFGFASRSAFQITMRVYRGGGLTKDAIYLRGLENLVRQLASPGQLERMFIGKAAARHLGILEELRHRGVLSPPPIRPLFLDRPGAAERLAKIVRKDFEVSDLIEEDG